MIDADPVFLAILAGSVVLTGIAAGVLGGLLGVGGGIIIVPVLYHIFTVLEIDEAVRMHVAVGTSLATIVVTSLASARAHYRKAGLDWALIKSWGPPIFVGVLIGTVIAGFVRGQVLTGVFAVVALIVAANMAFRREGWIWREALPKPPWSLLTAGGVGSFSAMMGIGGGTLMVPILSAFAYPIRKAVANGSVFGVIIGVPGSIGFMLAGLDVSGRPPAQLGYVNLIGFALIIPCTILAAPWGAKIAHAINPVMLRRAFAFFLLLTSLRMFYGLLG